MRLPYDAERLCEALWEAGGASALSDLPEAVMGSLSAPRERSMVVGYAERQGWLSKTGRKLELTGKGRLRFSPLQRARESASQVETAEPYLPPARELDSVLSRLPVLHALFVRLSVSAVVARYHLASSRNEPWPGFMAMGGSGTGKTTMHRLISRLFGFDPVSCTVNMTRAHTRGELKGIVSPGKGFMPSPYMTLPYLVFEEVDKEQSLISLVDPYFLGEISHETRGLSYRILPVPLILANPPDKGDRYSLIHPAWRRRSVFFDTQYMSPDDKAQIEDFADWLDSPGNLEPGLLRLEAFTVPERLSEPGKAVLHCVRELLSPDFRNRDLYCGVGPLELLALGHAALFGGSHEISAWHVGLYYLAVAGTIPGQIVPDALPIWEKLYDMAGSDTGSLRAVLRESLAESKRSRRETGLSKRIDPETAIIESMRQDRRKLSAIREIDRWLSLFNPDLFYDSTPEIEIAEAYGDDFRILRARVNSAKTVSDLDVLLKVLSKVEAEAGQHALALRAEIERIESREAPVPAEESPEPEEPAGDGEPSSVCSLCGSPAVVLAQIRKAGSSPLSLSLCTGDFAGMRARGDRDGFTVSVIDRYPVRLQPQTANSLPVGNGPRVPALNFASARLCQFPHILKKFAALSLTGNHGEYSSDSETVYCCQPCREKAITYLGNLGYSYFREEETRSVMR